MLVKSNFKISITNPIKRYSFKVLIFKMTLNDINYACPSNCLCSCLVLSNIPSFILIEITAIFESHRCISDMTAFQL